MDESSASSETAPPRRGCFGCVFTGSLGCGAFLLGSGLAAALFAPRLLGGFAARVVERMVSGDINGQVRIESIELAWTERQRVNGIKLLDAAGREVLVMSARIPPVFDLLDDAILNRRLDVKVSRADIVFDQNGVSNLLHALGTNGSPAELELAELRVGDTADILQRYRQLDVQVEHAVLSDLRRPAWSEEASGLSLGLQREGEELVGEVSVDSLGSAGGSLSLSWRSNNLLLEPWGAFQVQLESESVPLELLDALADLELGLAHHLGPLADVGLEASGDLRAGAGAPGVESRVSLSSDLAELTLLGTLENRELVLSLEDVDAVDPAANRIKKAETVADALSSRLLPPGHRVLANEADAEWSVTQFELRVPAGGWPMEALDADAARAGMSGALRLETREGLLWEAEDGAPLLRMTDVDLAFEARGDDPLAIRLNALPVLDEPEAVSGPLSVEVALQARLADLMAGPTGVIGLIPCSTAIEAAALPTRALDPFVGEPGLAGDALGPTVAVQLSMATAEEGCAIDCELRWRDRSLTWRGVLDDDVFRSADGSTIEGQIYLSRAFHERFVRRLVPWLDQLDKDPPTGLVRFTLKEFALPLSWKVVDMEGVLWTDFGTVDCTYRGGLAELLGPAGSEPYHGPLGPWTIEISRGYVHYREFDVRTSQGLTVLGGRLDLVRDGIELTASLPVSAVSHREGVDPSALGADANAVLPVRLTGAWQDPTVNVAIELNTLFDEVRGGLQDVPGRVKSVFGSIVDTLAPGNEQDEGDEGGADDADTRPD